MGELEDKMPSFAVNELTVAMVGMNEMFKSAVDAGFTETQALKIVAVFLAEVGMRHQQGDA